MDKFTIGADIELMLTRKGKLISAIPVLGEEGFELPHGRIFFDNVLAEFTIEPANNKSDFIRNIRENLKAAEARFAEHGIQIAYMASADYPKKELDNDLARVFGCDPDFCAYPGVDGNPYMNEINVCAEETTLRSAGAHVHFSHDIFHDIWKVISMIKFMDLFMGVPSILLDNTPEAIRRRQLYGKAGAHRPKDYPGGEYRSMSNWWVKSDEHIGWVYDRTERALFHTLRGDTIKTLGFDESTIQNVINNASLSEAQLIIEKL